MAEDSKEYLFAVVYFGILCYGGDETTGRFCFFFCGLHSNV